MAKLTSQAFRLSSLPGRVAHLLAMVDHAVLGYEPFFDVRLLVFPEFAHAAPIYETVGMGLSALLLWSLRDRMRPGALFALYLVRAYGIAPFATLLALGAGVNLPGVIALRASRSAGAFPRTVPSSLPVNRPASPASAGASSASARK